VHRQISTIILETVDKSGMHDSILKDSVRDI